MNELVKTLSLKIGIVVIVSLACLVFRALLTMNSGLPPTCVLAVLFSIGGGCNLGTWMVEKRGINVTLVRGGSAVVVGSLALPAVVYGAAPDQLGGFVREHLLVTHVLCVLFGAALGASFTPASSGEGRLQRARKIVKKNKNQ
eukprot:TRINITY_DN26282_c0_g1_i1.p1 TRINITY_DN26282_c0_g1~~TRINITY_DN26282_c0_g1_i1.p1  ORF type:complete len:154 (-),score=30.88 TRINITY_DN26282_c0_g1_i1:253-681(-)